MRRQGATHTAAEGAAERRTWRVITSYNQFGVLLALVLIILAVAAVEPRFVSSASLMNIGQGAAFYGIIALGMVFLLSMGEIDLSVGSIYGVTITAAALLITSRGWNPWLACVAGIALGALLGGTNGVIANALGVPAIIVTLGSLSMYRGLTLVLAGGHSVPAVPDSTFFTVVGGAPLNIPMSIWAFAVLALVLAVVYRSTRFGFVVRAIGSNAQAARLSGISLGRQRVLALFMVGGLCGVAGMLTFAFFQSADSRLGSGYELFAIAAAIIGGTGVSGGSGSVIGAMLGALIISVIQGALVQLSVDPNWSGFVTGAVIIAAVALDAFVRRHRVGRG